MATLQAIPRWAVDTIRMALVLVVGLTVFSVYSARGENHDETFYACLYAGALSQVNTVGPPANCGRGNQVSWNAEGIQGLPGVDGVSGWERVESEEFTVEPGSVNVGTAICPVGKVVLGGGPHLSGFDGASADLRFVVEETYPASSVGWNADVRNNGPEDIRILVYAICAIMTTEAP